MLLLLVCVAIPLSFVELGNVQACSELSAFYCATVYMH